MKHLSPKNIFIIDALGALLSCLFLAIILVHFQLIFGIPKQTLYLLAIFPFIFFMYDIICLLVVKTQLSKYLKVIGWLNVFYCIISIFLVLLHTKTITFLGWLYILGEILIILSLAKLELNTSNKN